MVSTARRRLALGIIPGVCLAATVALPLALAGRLPDELAVHFDIRGVSDGKQPLWMELALFAGMQAVMWRAAVIANRFGLRNLGWPYIALGLFTAAHGLILAANLGNASWTQARLPASPAVIVLVGGGTLGFLLGRSLSDPRLPRGSKPPPARVPVERPGLTVDERAAIFEPVRATWLLGFAALAAVLAFVTQGFSSTIAVIVTLVAVVSAEFAWVRVVINRGGVEVRFGPWSWPRKHIPLERIQRVEVEIVHAMAHRGWGYRLGPDGWIVLLKSGPALKIWLEDGRAFSVTMEHAAEAAGLIEDLIAEQSA